MSQASSAASSSLLGANLPATPAAKSVAHSHGCGGGCAKKANHGACTKPLAQQCLGCLRHSWNSDPTLRAAISAEAASRGIDTDTFAQRSA